MVCQRGMSTNCSLYQLGSLLDEFWDAKIYRDGQFSSEVDQFAAFLRKYIADGIVSNPFTAELLEFEFKLNVLKCAPRKRSLREIEALPAPGPDTPSKRG